MITQESSKQCSWTIYCQIIRIIAKICKKTPWTLKLLRLLWKIVEITPLLWDDNAVVRQSLLTSLCIVILKMYVRGYNLEFWGFRSKLMQLKKCTIISQLLNSTNKVALKPTKYWMASSNECTVKLGNKERFDKEQIGIKEPFPVTNLPFTS